VVIDECALYDESDHPDLTFSGRIADGFQTIRLSALASRSVKL